MSVPATASRPPASDEATARRGDLIIIRLRHRDHADGGSWDHDELRAGQVTAVTRGGLARLYRPAGDFPGEPDGQGRPDRGVPLPAGFQRAWIMSARRVDVQGALATAACRTWPGHEDQARGYDTLEDVRAALRPHLLTQPGWEQLRAAATTWEAARKAAAPLLHAAIRAQGDEADRLSGAYHAAVTAANNAYRQQYAQATAPAGEAARPAREEARS
jgi:hypothetical protein